MFMRGESGRPGWTRRIRPAPGRGDDRRHLTHLLQRIAVLDEVRESPGRTRTNRVVVSRHGDGISGCLRTDFVARDDDACGIDGNKLAPQVEEVFFTAA